jgi:hypothetical protein
LGQLNNEFKNFVKRQSPIAHLQSLTGTTYLLASQDVGSQLDLAECALAQGLTQHIVANRVWLLPRTTLSSWLVQARSGAAAHLGASWVGTRCSATFLRIAAIVDLTAPLRHFCIMLSVLPRCLKVIRVHTYNGILKLRKFLNI